MGFEPSWLVLVPVFVFGVAPRECAPGAAAPVTAPPDARRPLAAPPGLAVRGRLGRCGLRAAELAP